jgi:pyruvate formate lyase activating enzyme
MLGEIPEGEGVVSNIQRFSIHDGPGIRTTVFLKGCPLHCKWCSNPESMEPLPQIIARDAKCIGSGRCIDACEKRAISFVGGSRTIDWDRCDQCLKCVDVCPSRSIEANGRYMSVAEVMDTVERDASYYRRTGGGMTLSGGEPLLQGEFALRLLQEAKRRGLHTALDTAGCSDWDVLDAILDYTDLVLYDVKHTDPDKHREGTGMPNQRILENLRRTVKKAGVKVWIRHPVIPRFNDSEDEFEELCRLVPTLGPSVEKISLLPYHKFAELKYAATGREYPYRGIPLLDERRIAELRKLAESHDLEVEVGR